MRTKITIFAIGLLVASSASAQGLKRPVDAATEPEVSLADLARQVNPKIGTGGTSRVYTNADLRVRPAPVAPTMPPFPDIAAPTGILEHPGVPMVQPIQAPAVEQYYGGVPFWDGFGGFVDLAPGLPFKGRTPIQRGSAQLGIDGRFSKSSSPSDILLGPLGNNGGLLPRSSFRPRSGSRGGSHGGGRGGSRGGGRGR